VQIGEIISIADQLVADLTPASADLSPAVTPASGSRQ
jgi:hypothetical protein